MTAQLEDEEAEEEEDKKEQEEDMSAYTNDLSADAMKLLAAIRSQLDHTVVTKKLKHVLSQRYVRRPAHRGIGFRLFRANPRHRERTLRARADTAGNTRGVSTTFQRLMNHRRRSRSRPPQAHPGG